MPLAQKETDAHHGIPSLRFPRTPLPQTSHIVLEHTARNGDDIDTTGYIDPVVRGEATLEKCYSALRQVDMHRSLCIANLFTQNIPTVPGPLWVRIPPMSTYIRVLCYLLNYHRGTLKMYSALRPDGLNTTTLTLVQP